MAEYLANAVQTVALNNPILFDASIPCNRGYIYHEDETGVFILKGVTDNCFARYLVDCSCNIAVPTEGEVTAIAIAITENGEVRPTSRSIYTPAAVDEYGNVFASATITVPKGCCFSISARYVDATTLDAAVVPTPLIEVQNARLRITRTA